MANPEHERNVRKAAAGELADADFSGCDLSGLRFPSAKLAGLRLAEANLRRADLAGAYLQGADLSSANLAQARLGRADLRKANLRGASLKSADLSATMLMDADLREADLTKCQLTKSTLAGADLTGADLAGADLRGARGITPEQIRAARNWSKAVFDPPTAKLLGIEQDAAVARHGAKDATKPGKRRSVAVDILAAVPIGFGDLFLICGDQHPRFPPNGQHDLSGLAKLGFAQCDDYFAITNSEGDPLIWLYPLLRGNTVGHHPGPFEGIRLELPRVTKALAPKFLAAASAFAQILDGGVNEVADEKRGPALTLEELGRRVDALLAKK